MRAQDLMTRPALTCRATNTLNDAAKLMWECDCGAIPVVDDEGTPIGMITDRDICMACYTQGRPLTQIRIGAVMSPNVISCRVDETIAATEGLMRRHQIRRLPVVALDGSIAGVLSLNDIATHAQGKQVSRIDGLNADAVATTLAAICAKDA